MTITTAITANNILNRAAVEIGLEPLDDPFGSTDPFFVQLKFLLQSLLEDMALAYPWEQHRREHQIQTVAADTGDYPLPDDFHYMIDQTGWERTGNVPLFGPLSPQDWAYLLGRDLVSQTIYASFRLMEGNFSIFPQPPPSGLDINFEYQSQFFVRDGVDPQIFKPAVIIGIDVPLFDRTLLTRGLKARYLESKGFDSTAASFQFDKIFNMLTGKDKGAEVLSAGRNSRGFPYLDTYNNAPDTGYGSPT